MSTKCEIGYVKVVTNVTGQEIPRGQHKENAQQQHRITTQQIIRIPPQS